MARRAARRAGGTTDPAQSDQVTAPQEAAPSDAPPAPPASSSGDQLADLQKLSDLHDEGVLTDEEFETQKEKILAAL